MSARIRRFIHRAFGRGTHFYSWSEIKAEKSGGPAARCTYCGRAAR